jgi:hypothetical protein
MKKIISFLICLLLGTVINAQKVIKEVTFDPEGKAKITNLSEVQIDEANNSMRLFYLTKSTERKVKAEILYFDLDFNFIKSENFEEDLEKVREKYNLRWGWAWQFCKEDSQPLLRVESTPSAQAVFKKGYIDSYWNWYTGFCDDKFKVEEKVKPKGEDGERLKLLNFWTNNELQEYVRQTSTVYSHGGLTYASRTSRPAKTVMDATKGDVVICASVIDKKNKAEFGMHWVFDKFSAATLERTKSTPLDFPVAAAPLGYKFLSSGNVAYMFQRADNKFEYIEVEFDGTIVRRNDIDVPNEFTWAVFEMSEVGDDLYIHGVTAKNKVNAGTITQGSIFPAQSIAGRNALAEKPNGYQMMKVSASKIEWVTFTNEAEFKPTFIQIGTEKGKPYAGGILKIRGLHVGPTGNIFVTGQKYTSGGGVTVAGQSLASYQEVVAFNFSSTGKLLSNYSTKLRDKNEINKTTPTEHALLNTPTGDGVFWTVFEVAGQKKLGSTARTLYYPRVARISNDGKTTSDFLEIGEGRYYLDDKFPVNPIKDNKVIFIGSDRKGKNMWFSKVLFE